MPITKHRARGPPECGGAAGTEALVSLAGRRLTSRPTGALLLSDEAHADGAMKDEDIARVLQIGRATVERVRRRCVEEGIEAALGRKRQLNTKHRAKRIGASSEATRRSKGSPPDCPGLRRTAGRPGRLDAETVGPPAGRMRDRGKHALTVRQTLKKTNQALAEGIDPSVRLCDAISLPGLPGRDQQATGERDASAASGPAWGSGLLRLRIRAQRGEQPFHVVRSAGRVAPGGSDGPAHESRLGPGGQATGGRTTRTRTVLCW